MKKLVVVILFLSFVMVGCSPVWKSYYPPMENMLGSSVKLSGDQVIVGSKPSPKMYEKFFEVDTRISALKEEDISSADRELAINLLKGSVEANLKISKILDRNITADDLVVDFLKNWEDGPSGCQFVYAGIRAKKVEIDIKESTSLPEGTVKIGEIGTATIKNTSTNHYKISIDNPKVYYKIQVAKIKQTFPEDEKYSNGWITKSARGKTSIKPLVLSKNKNEGHLWRIQAHTHFWKKYFGWLFGFKQMPYLDLLFIDGELFVEYSRLKTINIPLASYEKDGKWLKKSIFIDTFKTGTFEKKVIVLDIDAYRKDDKIIVEHARIRYPEYQLSIF